MYSHLADLDTNCKCTSKHKEQNYVWQLQSILLILSVDNFYGHQLKSEQNFGRVKFHHLCCGGSLLVRLYIFYWRCYKKQWCFELC